MRLIIGFLFLIQFYYVKTNVAEDSKTEYCSSEKAYNMYQKCDNTSRVYMLDLSSDFMSVVDFYNVKSLLDVLSYVWFTQNKKRRSIKIVAFNATFDNAECTSKQDCIDIIDSLTYENSIRQNSGESDLIIQDDETTSLYVEFFRENVTNSLDMDCALNSVVLLTNRIVDIKDFGGHTFLEYIDIFCIKFSVILLGRNESKAEEDLKEFYGDFIPWSTIFDVRDYRCVESLVNCIPPDNSLPCPNIVLDGCTFSTTTVSPTWTTSSVSTKSSSIITTITTTIQKSITTTTDSQPSGQSDKGKTILIIVGSIVGGAVVILCLCFLFYRRHVRKKRLEQIWLSHQNPENIDEWELTWDKLLIKNEELGSGAYGQVLQGKLLEVRKSKNGKYIEDNKEVAIKILQRYTNERSEKNFLHEIQVMKQISGHKHIVKMIGCITVGDRICLVLEFCLFRDLLQYVKNSQTELLTFLQTADHIKKEFLIFTWQISQGMQFLASEGIIHRDLAARNILIDEFKIAKISDFGLCVQTNDKLKNSTSNNVLDLERGKLPVKWLAIESLKSYEFSLQSDIWSFGIVMYEMFSFGEIPFADIETSELLSHLEAGNRPSQPELCSDEIYEVMTKCWNSNPSQRPSFDELITIFTVFLEFATENYGYIDVLKAETGDPKELENIFRFENV